MRPVPTTQVSGQGFFFRQRHWLWVLLVVACLLAPSALGAGALEGNVDADEGQRAAGSAPAATDLYDADLLRGGAAFRIPLELPPGGSGPAPQLELGYLSDGDRKSWVGSGWTLDVGEVIRRGPGDRVATFTPDDVFHLQLPGYASELTPHPTLAGHYVTVHEQHLRIRELGLGWEVTTGDGTRYLLDTPVYANDLPADEWDSIRSWRLTRVEDAQGHGIDYLYDVDPVGSDVYLSEVRYTTGLGLDAGRRVTFELEERCPGVAADDCHDVMVSYATGARVVLDQRLARIRVWSDAAQTVPYASYRLLYDNPKISPTSWDGTGARLVAVERHDADGALGERWAFEYTSRGAGWEETPNTGWSLPSYFVELMDTTDAPKTVDRGVRLSDYDGDGRTDLMVAAVDQGTGSPTHRVLRNTGAGAFPEQTTTFPNGFGGPVVFTWGRTCSGDSWPILDGGARVMDVNGDMLPDVLLAAEFLGTDCPYGPRREVYLNTGNGWSAEPAPEWSVPYDFVEGCSTSQLPQPWSFLNLDGDGCPDALYSRFDLLSPQSEVALNGCDGTWDVTTEGVGSLPSLIFTPCTESCDPAHCDASCEPLMRDPVTPETQFADFNGDGLDDWVDCWELAEGGWTCFLRLNAGGRGWEYDPALSQRLFPSGKIEDDVRFADVNGDGYPDRISNCEVQLHRQNAGFAQGCDTPPGSGRTCTDTHNRQHTDACTPHDQTWYFDGDYGPFNPSDSVNADSGTRLVDIDADGLVDFVNAHIFDQCPMPDNLNQSVWLAEGEVPGLLSRVTLPTGGTLEFDYVPSSQFDHDGHEDAPGVGRMPFVKPVLSQVRVNDGLGGSYTTGYHYDGGGYDRIKHRFRGFRTVTETWPDGTATRTTFYQRRELEGRTERVELLDDTGAALRTVVTSYTRDLAVPLESTTEVIPEGGDCYDHWAGTGCFVLGACNDNPQVCVNYPEAESCDLFEWSCDDAYEVTPANYDDAPPYDNRLRYIATTTHGPSGDRTAVVQYDYIDEDGDGITEQELVWELGEPGVTPLDELRTTVTRYVPDTTDWLVRLPARVRVYVGQVYDDDALDWVKETTYRYGTAAWAVPPTDSLLTRRETCGQLGSYPLAGTEDCTDERFSYDPVYRYLADSRDPNGHVTTYVRADDPAGDHGAHLFVTHTTDALGHVSEVDYDVHGRVESATGIDGVREEINYDALHRVTETRLVGTDGSLQARSTTDYVGLCDTTCPAGEPTVTVDPAGQSLRVSELQGGGTWLWNDRLIDGLGRTYRTASQGTHPDAPYPADADYDRLVDTRYDHAGRIDQLSLPYYRSTGSPDPADATRWSATTYDSAGRLASVRAPSADADPVVTSYAYDGWSTTVTDPRGNARKFELDADGNVVTTTEWLDGTPHTLAFTWDVLGNLSEVHDDALPGRPLLLLEHDGLGRKRQLTDADMGSWLYEYDPAGQLVHQVDTAGHQATMTYDPLGRLLVRQHVPGGGQVPHADVFEYDTLNGETRGASAGKLILERSQDALRLFTYDVAGRRSEIDATVGGLLTRELHTFDLLGAIVRSELRTTTPEGAPLIGAPPREIEPTGGSGGTIEPPTGGQDPVVTVEVREREYDASGLLRQLHGSLDGVPYRYLDAVDYDAHGKLAFLAYGNGVTSSYLYDDLAGHRLQSIVTEGPLGAVLQDLFYDYDASGNVVSIVDAVSGVAKSYTYDTADRLVQATVGAEIRSYGYDPLGNVLSVTGPYAPFEAPYAPGASDSVEFTYALSDATHPAHAPVGDDYYDYTWDPNGSLTAVTPHDPTGLSLTLEYNSWGKLHTATSSSSTTTYCYDPRGERVAKSGPQGEAYYFDTLEFRDGRWLSNLDVGGRRVAELDYASGAVRYYHPDHLGSTTTVTDTWGSLVVTREYYEFGAVQTEWLSPDTWPVAYGFTDQEHDRETDFYDYGARVYVSRMFQFATPDPVVPDVRNPQAFNRYAYVLNNPLRYVDPTGHFAADAAQFLETKVIDPAKELARSQGAYDQLGPVVAPAADFAISTFLDLTAGAAADVLSMGDQSGEEFGLTGEVGVGTLVEEAGRAASIVGAAGKGIGAALGAAGKAMNAAGKNIGKATAGVNVNKAANGATGATMGGRAAKKLKPDPKATGAHSTWKTDAEGNITGHAEWQPNPRNPSGFDEAQRVDLTGDPHFNKVTGRDVPTPHTHRGDTPGKVRPALPEEIPGKERQ